MACVGHDVERETGVGRAMLVGQQAVLDHHAPAAEAFLARLEHQPDLSIEVLRAFGQQPCRARQHGGVPVMAAGMHPALGPRREGQAGFLCQRQRVHVAAQHHAAPLPGGGTAPFQHGDRAGRLRAFAPFQRQAGQCVLHLRQRARRFQPQFGIGMDRASQCHDLVPQRLGGLCNRGTAVAGGSRVKVHGDRANTSPPVRQRGAGPYG